jgi:hypothetical protein
VKRIGVLTGGDDARGLDAAIRAIVRRGIGQSREGGIDAVRRTVDDLRLDGLIAIAARGCSRPVRARPARASRSWAGRRRSTDMSGTDACIGFRTAVQVATDAIDRLPSSATFSAAGRRSPRTGSSRRGSDPSPSWRSAARGPRCGVAGTRIVEVPLETAARVRRVPDGLFDLAEGVFE